MLLKLGSTGEDVKKLQTKLALTADGNFGPGTEAKVKEWQTQNGLTADGVIGDISWAKMFPPVVETLKLDKLKGLIPDSVIAQIPDTAKKFNITSNLRLCHFLAQCATESGNFKVVKENLFYSADGLVKIFPKYFNTATAPAYAKQPQKIANKVYANRMGNGAESTNEGYLYSGKGMIQLTGKSNYAAFSKFIGEDCVANPDLVATKYPLASAAFFFNSNGLWSICDKGSDDTTVTSVSKRVNGGVNGLAERLSYFKKFYSALTA